MNEIKPFRIDISQADLDDLRDRLARTRWPSPALGDAWSRGVPLDYLRELAGYWRNRNFWRKHEPALNEWPPSTTPIYGPHLPFPPVPVPGPDALPFAPPHARPRAVLV